MVGFGRTDDLAIISQAHVKARLLHLHQGGYLMVPIVLWLLGVPLSLIIVLFVLGVGR